jgi:hypothetical protein
METSMRIGTIVSRLGVCAALLMMAYAPARQRIAEVAALLAGSASPPGATLLQAGSGPIRYRVEQGSMGDIVERSTDGGVTWSPVLSPVSDLRPAQQGAPAVGAGTCSPVLYSAVSALVPTGTGDNQVYVATDGEQGNYLDGACAGTIGGIYAVGSAGDVHALGTTGLPFDQDPVERTNRSYSIDLIVPDPAHPGTLYVHAGAGAGPDSPPAGLYKSIDSGATWTEIDAGLQSSYLITNSAGMAVPVYDAGSLTITDASGMHLQFQNDTGSYVSTDAGATWEHIGGGPPAASANLYVAAQLQAGVTPIVAPWTGTAMAQVTPMSPVLSPQGSFTALPPSVSSALGGVTTGALDEGWAVDNAGRVLVTPEQIAATRAVGARFVRLNFRLGNAADWTNGTLLAAYNKVVNAYLAAGIQVVGLVTQEATHGSQADWTANNHENTNGNGDNAFIADAYVRGALQPLLSHFHDRVKIWELWNEPNAYQRCSGTVCTGGSFMYPSNLAALMADGYAAIKDPPPVGLGLNDVTLILGGVLGHSIGGVYSPNNAGTTYLLNAYTMGMQITGTWLAFATAHQGALPLDALGQHLYIDQNLLTTDANVSAYLGWIHEVAMQFGKQLPTYVTEASWSTRNLPQAVQAANLDTLFQAAKQSGYVPMTTWFELRDVPQNGLYFGLQDRTGTNKQSYSRYQSQAGGTLAPTSTPAVTSMPGASLP